MKLSKKKKSLLRKAFFSLRIPDLCRYLSVLAIRADHVVCVHCCRSRLRPAGLRHAQRHQVPDTACAPALRDHRKSHPVVCLVQEQHASQRRRRRGTYLHPTYHVGLQVRRAPGEQCLSPRLSVCLPVCLPISGWPADSVSMLVCLSVCLSLAGLLLYLHACLSFCPWLTD